MGLYMCVGDCSLISDCEHTDSGELSIGGQAHFYFEPQSCIVVPTGQIGIFVLWSYYSTFSVYL